MVEMVVKLVLVGGVMIAALLGLRHASRKGMTNRGGPNLQIVGRAGLTRNALVAVVMVDERRYLVGAGEQGISLLADLDAPPAPAMLAAPTPTSVADLDVAAAIDITDDTDSTNMADITYMADVTDITTATHRTGHDTHGPRIGPMDRLREMTVRSHLREPIRARSDHPA